MKVEWLLESIEDRHEVFTFVEDEDFRAAIKQDEMIESQTDALGDFPMMGKVGERPGTRELVIAGTPYISIYSVSEDHIRILRVLHGARDRKDLVWRE